jgi:hypothetical protein
MSNHWPIILTMYAVSFSSELTCNVVLYFSFFKNKTMFKLGKPRTETHHMLKHGFAKDIMS